MSENTFVVVFRPVRDFCLIDQLFLSLDQPLVDLLAMKKNILTDGWNNEFNSIDACLGYNSLFAGDLENQAIKKNLPTWMIVPSGAFVPPDEDTEIDEYLHLMYLGGKSWALQFWDEDGCEYECELDLEALLNDWQENQPLLQVTKNPRI